MARLQIVWEEQDLKDLQPGVLVCMYPHAVNTPNDPGKACGRVRRRYHAEFTEAERKLITRYYTIFYDWEFRRGIPENMCGTVATWHGGRSVDYGITRRDDGYGEFVPTGRERPAGQRYPMTARTYQLLERAVGFFASV